MNSQLDCKKAGFLKYFLPASTRVTIYVYVKETKLDGIIVRNIVIDFFIFFISFCILKYDIS
jgi:hypothetical protein